MECVCPTVVLLKPRQLLGIKVNDQLQSISAANPLANDVHEPLELQLELYSS